MDRNLCFEKISFAFHLCLSLFNQSIGLMPSHSQRLKHLFLVNWGAKLGRLEELFHGERLRALQAFVSLIAYLPHLQPLVVLWTPGHISLALIYQSQAGISLPVHALERWRICEFVIGSCDFSPGKVKVLIFIRLYRLENLLRLTFCFSRHKIIDSNIINLSPRPFWVIFSVIPNTFFLLWMWTNDSMYTLPLLPETHFMGETSWCHILVKGD